MRIRKLAAKIGCARDGKTDTKIADAVRQHIDEVDIRIEQKQDADRQKPEPDHIDSLLQGDALPSARGGSLAVVFISARDRCVRP